MFVATKNHIRFNYRRILLLYLRHLHTQDDNSSLKANLKTKDLYTMLDDVLNGIGNTKE
jgi:hypothetical protein